jgi:hypothetical protein
MAENLGAAKRNDVTKRRAKREQTRGQLADDGFAKRRSLVSGMAPLLKEAERLGIFTGDRDLLTCPSCGLMEDVLFDGRLVTVTKSDSRSDSGMRFTEESAGIYKCPGCGAQVLESPEELQPVRSRTKLGAFTGSWRITEMELWDQDAIDLLGPAHIKFDADRSGEFVFIAVRGWMDCTFGEKDGQPFVEFSWQGSDEGDDVSGRGWATLDRAGRMTGRIYFHRGDNSAFTAAPFPASTNTRKRRG